MKKVLVLNPYLPTLGGGEKYMGYLCQCIEEYYDNEVKIDILVHNYNSIDIHDKNYVTIEDFNDRFGLKLKNTYIRKIELSMPNNLKESLSNKQLVENITKDYDLFINFMFLSKHIGKAKKNIYICMFPPKSYAKEIKGNLFKNIGAKYYDYKFKNSYDVFVNISQFTNHWLKEYWNKQGIIVYPPVFSEKNIYTRYNENEKKNIIISTGRFFVGAHNKKQLEMVQMFLNNEDKFRDYEYHLVGAVSNYKEDIDYFDEIKRLASKSNKIHIHESYPFEDLMKLYEKAKIFWHGTGYGEDENTTPDKMEHFGITTVEAMSFGAIPIVINKGGQKETVKQGINGYLWDTEKECIDKTLEIINNEEKRINMAKICVEKAKDYSIETFFEKNKEIFDQYNV